jgi:hypothetical protein
MPATAARIAFVTNEFRTVVSSNSAIKTRYGTAARDSATTTVIPVTDAPIETFFDSTTDAQTMCDERFALLKADRRKFGVTVASLLDFSGALAFTANAPAATLIDREKSANLSVAITGISALDYESGSTTLTCWG